MPQPVASGEAFVINNPATVDTVGHVTYIELLMGWAAAVGVRGATIIPPDPPAPPGSYGPTDGRTAVINGAGPRTVADPGGGISFNSASDLQTKINANVANSIFVPSVSSIDWTTRVLANGKHPNLLTWSTGEPHLRCGESCAVLHDRRWRCYRRPGSIRPLVAERWVSPGGGHVLARTGLHCSRCRNQRCIPDGDIHQGGCRHRDWILQDPRQRNGRRAFPLVDATNCWVHHGEYFGNGYRDPENITDHGGSGKFQRRYDRQRS